jgi:hypothetical protein
MPAVLAPPPAVAVKAPPTAHRSLSPITIRPAPPLDPPYDEEPTAPGAVSCEIDPGVQPMLPLDWSPSRRHRFSAPAWDWTSACGPGPVLGRDGAEAAAIRRAVSSPARGAAMHFLSLCLEVLNGFRPAWHLRPLTTPMGFTRIAEQLSGATSRLPAHGADRIRVKLRDLRVCEPLPGVAEAAAVLGQDDRVWAMALRLERRPASWQCTLLHVI